MNKPLPHNHGKLWTKSNDRAFIKKVRQEHSLEYLRTIFGRTEESLRQRLLMFVHAEAKIRAPAYAPFDFDPSWDALTSYVRNQPSGFTNRALNAVYHAGCPDPLTVKPPSFIIEPVSLKEPMTMNHKFFLTVSITNDELVVESDVAGTTEQEAIELGKKLAFENPGQDYYLAEVKTKFSAGSVRSQPLKVAPKGKKGASKDA